MKKYSGLIRMYVAVYLIFSFVILFYVKEAWGVGTIVALCRRFIFFSYVLNTLLMTFFVLVKDTPPVGRNDKLVFRRFLFFNFCYAIGSFIFMRCGSSLIDVYIIMVILLFGNVVLSLLFLKRWHDFK